MTLIRKLRSSLGKEVQVTHYAASGWIIRPTTVWLEQVFRLMPFALITRINFSRCFLTPIATLGKSNSNFPSRSLPFVISLTIIYPWLHNTFSHKYGSESIPISPKHFAAPTRYPMEFLLFCWGILSENFDTINAAKRLTITFTWCSRNAGKRICKGDRINTKLINHFAL